MSRLLLQGVKSPLLAVECQRYIHTSANSLAGGDFRKRIGLPADSVSYGPLCDIPDWSYADKNEPTPLSSNAVFRDNRRRFIASMVEMAVNEMMIGKYQHALSMQLRPHELTMHPKRLEANIERSRDVPILSATAEDIPQPPNVDRDEGKPILYTLQEGRAAANRRARSSKLAMFEVMSQDAIKKQLEST
ncbi:large ribosomal subunit protein mL52-like [Sycon ciliatum]|uniref:large ribosomal subunit protein mL52-like n=1 Tax=Sycon ciliatum TaxID=27933 RepID=UPI0020A92C51|eukprot:scpid86695/ scgid24760/ 39S ribosomal protein L52, mitochondrial